MPATQSDIDGLKEANDGLAYALRNCERAARGEAPRTRAQDQASQLGDIFANIGRTTWPFN